MKMRFFIVFTVILSVRSIFPSDAVTPAFGLEMNAFSSSVSEEKTLFLHIDYIRTKNMEKQALNRIKVMLTEHMLTNKPT